jgi:thiol-disulfide isomerase/thioredoxin
MKNKSLLVLITFALLSSCGFIVIVDGKWENPDEFKVPPNTKPSELINTYLNNYEQNKLNNYCISFYVNGCGACLHQVPYCNQLYQETKDNYNWIAVTIDDSIKEDEFRKKMGYKDDYLKYDYPTYYDIEGLKSSLRNLYYNNKITEVDFVPMTFFIPDDTIRYITDGSINSKEKYDKHKRILDSLALKVK